MSIKLTRPENQRRRNITIGLAAAFIVLVLGLILQISKGAGFFAFLNPTDTTVNGNATLITDANIPGGKALQFGNTPTPTPPPTPTPTPNPGQLPANTLPKGGDVGFLGDESKLIVADAGKVPAGLKYNSAGGYFELASVANHTFEGYKFLRPVKLSDTLSANAGVTLTFKNNVFAVAGNQPYGGLTYQGSLGTNNFIIQDNTFKAATPLAGLYGNGQIQMDARCTIQRNDVSGRGDGIQNGSGQCLIEQNHVHSPGNWGTYPNNTHNDGIQFYSGSGIQIRYNRIDIGWDGEHQNGALFFQGNFTGPVIDNNYLSGGGYILRLESGVKNAVVTNNTFKRNANDFGTHLTQGTVTTWSGNVLAPNNTPLNK